MRKKTLLLLVAMAFVFMPFVHAQTSLEEFFLGNIVSTVNVAFDYVVKFIQWIFLAAQNVVFIILFIGYFAMLFGIGWAVTKVEPYVKKVGELTKKLKQWVEGGK